MIAAACVVGVSHWRFQKLNGNFTVIILLTNLIDSSKIFEYLIKGFIFVSYSMVERRRHGDVGFVSKLLIFIVHYKIP